MFTKKKFQLTAAAEEAAEKLSSPGYMLRVRVSWFIRVTQTAKESHPGQSSETQVGNPGKPGKPNAHLRHDFDLLVPALEGQRRTSC